MNSNNTLPTLQVDGISFLGGGVRCAPSQYAFMCLVMNKLKLSPEELFYKVKYLSGNSGAAFTISTLLYYPKMMDVWPLHKVKNMSQSDLDNFYKEYWIKPLQDYLIKKVPFISTNDKVFDAFGLSNVGLNSWLNALTTYAIAPFANRIGDTKWKDMPFANSMNLVVSLGATALQTSSMRSKTGSIYNESVYLQSTDYTWSKTWPDTVSGLKGFPINLIYGYNNKIQTDTTFLNGDAGQVTYTSQTSNKDDCHLDKILSYLHPKVNLSKQTSPLTKSVSVPNTTLGQSQLGESIFLAVAAASSSFVGCSPQQMPSDLGDCANNFVNYDQPIMFDFKQGLVLANTKNQITSFPQDPWKDNGTLDLSSNTSPTFLNLCDGTNSYDNTGIIPMIRGFQMYETQRTLKNKKKRFTIFYVDGVDPGDQQSHSNIPSYGHFAKLFTKLDGATDYTQAAFGLNIFDSDCSVPTFQYTSQTLKDDLGGDVSLKLYFYENLTTIKNDFCGVQPGIKINIIALTPMVQLNTMYQSWADLDNHATVNKLLIQLMNEMNDKHNWITQLFRKPPTPTSLGFSCDESTYQCVPGTQYSSLADCQTMCNQPSPTPTPTPGPTPSLTSNFENIGKTFGVILVIVAIFVVVAIVAHRHHEIHYSHK